MTKKYIGETKRHVNVRRLLKNTVCWKRRLVSLMF